MRDLLPILCILAILGQSALLRSQDVVRERSRQTQVLYDMEVVVIGGGHSGVGAAVGAARRGAKTLLVERTGYLGSWHRALGLGMRFGTPGVRPSLREGIMKEVVAKLLKITSVPACLDFAYPWGRNLQVMPDNPSMDTTRCPDLDTLLEQEQIGISQHELLPYVFQSLVQESGAKILFFANYSSAVVENGRIQAITVETPTGRFAIRGKAFVDCTGLATVAADAGSPVLKEESHMGLMSEITKVDGERFLAWARTRPKEGSPELRKWIEGQLGGPIVRFDGSVRKIGGDTLRDYPWDDWWTRSSGMYGDLLRQAVEKGEIPLYYKVGKRGIVSIIEGLKIIKQEINGFIARPRTRIAGVDPTNGEEASEAHIKSVDYLFKFTAFLRNYVPGFEKAQLTRLGNATMYRSGRYIDTGFAPSRKDLGEGRKSEDAIYVTQRRGGASYEVPYKTLLAERVDNLLVVGKASSGGKTFRTQGVTMIMGQAAGTAAGIAAVDGVLVRDISLQKLRRAINDSGIMVPERFLKN